MISEMQEKLNTCCHGFFKQLRKSRRELGGSFEAEGPPPGPGPGDTAQFCSVWTLLNTGLCPGPQLQ